MVGIKEKLISSRSTTEWYVITVLFALIVSYFLAILSFCLMYFISSTGGAAPYMAFFKKSIFEPTYLLSRYWWWAKLILRNGMSLKLYFWLPILPIISFPTIIFFGYRLKSKPEKPSAKDSDFITIKNKTNEKEESLINIIDRT